ncbi:MAG: haloacid dehalogenase-like hydrolase [Thermoplasmata archaeon]|nr:haloacid dehalogenase-like hydrolase [Thermoplasmata archaeon]
MSSHPLAAPTWPLITVDIDGTLTTVHGWKVIADALGRRAEFERTQRRFFAKEIGEDEHLQNMLSLAEGRTVSEVEAALEATPRLDGIAEGIRAFHANGSRVALLSHNPSYVGRWYQRKFGFDDFEGTGAQAVVDGVIGPVEGLHADKPAGLRALVARQGTSATRVVHIGDGWADAVVFRLVARGVALNSSLPEVERAADLVLRADDFRDVVRAVEALRPRP